MKKGRPQKIDWEKYRVRGFKHPDPVSIPLPSCGAFALHSITKIPLHKLEPLATKVESWPTHIVLGFLRSQGYEVIPITYGNTVAAHSVKEDKPMLRDYHVILTDQACYREESSWGVLYGGLYSHSGEIYPTPTLEFLNYPIQAAYLIWHPKWARLNRKWAREHTDTFTYTCTYTSDVSSTHCQIRVPCDFSPCHAVVAGDLATKELKIFSPEGEPIPMRAKPSAESVDNT
jgi:hypothetical protein